MSGLCGGVFISRLRDNYTQWGGSCVGAKGRSGQRERGDPGSGLRACGGGERRRDGRDEGKDGWASLASRLIGRKRALTCSV